MNDDNLKGRGFESRTTAELREICAKGGRNSGKARRRKADFKKMLNAILTAEVPIGDDQLRQMLETLGIDPTLEAAVNMAMIRAALAGDVRAYEAVAKYSGQAAKTDADEEEQRIRTDRARQNRNAEAGDPGQAADNIRSFLDAMRPSEGELKDLFKEGCGDAEDI